MKKLAALCLALLMLALPVLGFAATSGEMIDNAREAGMPMRTTVTFTPADLSGILGEEIATAYSDMLNALSLEWYQAEDEGRLSAKLSGQDVLTLSGAIEDDTVYLNSNILGSRSVAVAENEWQPLLEKLVDLLVKAGEMDAEEAALVKAQLAGMFSGELAAQMDAEEAFADVDWTPVIELATGLFAEKGAVEEVAEQPADCDEAAMKITLNLSGEDVVKVYSTVADCLRKSDSAMAFLDKQLASADMTAEEMLTKIISTLEEAMAEVATEMPMAVYLSAEEDVVAMDMTITMTAEGTTLTMPMTYRRKTVEQGVSHTLDVKCTAAGGDVMTVSLLYLDTEDAGLVTFEMKAEDGGDAVLMTADAVFDDKNVDASLKMDVTESGETTTLTMTLVSTGEENKSNTDFNLKVSADDEEVGIALKLSDEQTPGNTYASGQGSMSLVISISGVEMALEAGYDTAAQTGENSVRRETNADVGLTVMGMEIPLLSAKAVTESCDVLASLAEGESVHPGAMSDEELSAYGHEVIEDAQTAVLALIQNLPASVLKLLTDN